MSYEIVHTFGFTVYFVFLLFFLWVSRFARTTSGAGWWAASLACALCGRLALFLMLPASDTIELDMTVDEALKYIISMGVVAPPPRPRVVHHT